MINPFIEGIRKTITELIPDTLVTATLILRSKFIPPVGFIRGAPVGETGFSFSSNRCQFWFDYKDARVCNFEISRNGLPFTRNEKRMLGRLPDSIFGLLYPFFSHKQELVLRIAGRIGYEHVLISSFLRRNYAASFWVPAFVVLQLQELTFCTYEGEPCTSGFIYSSQPDLYFTRLERLEYTVIRFADKILVSEGHFAKPAAYRYVDGKNAFYLIDNFLNIHGIIKINDPKKYSRIERSNYAHVSPLVDHMPGRPWAACIGNNSDVNVLMSGNVHLIWQKNHWHLFERSLLSDLLLQFGCNQQTTANLTAVISALSSLRKGCVLLILKDNEPMPHVVGSIDDTTLAKALRISILNRNINDLVEDQSIIGVLSSDGLTTLSPEGKVVSCGDIIDISRAFSLSVAGGGRSQAAIAASFSGMSIKVSEDGPISVYEQGRRLISL